MQRNVYRHGNRLVVGYALPGTDTVGVECDFPLASRAAARADADRRTRAAQEPPYVPPGERISRRGFDETS